MATEASKHKNYSSRFLGTRHLPAQERAEAEATPLIVCLASAVNKNGSLYSGCRLLAFTGHVSGSRCPLFFSAIVYLITANHYKQTPVKLRCFIQPGHRGRSILYIPIYSVRMCRANRKWIPVQIINDLYSISPVLSTSNSDNFLFFFSLPKKKSVPEETPWPRWRCRAPCARPRS